MLKQIIINICVFKINFQNPKKTYHWICSNSIKLSSYTNDDIEFEQIWFTKRDIYIKADANIFVKVGPLFQ